MKKLLCLLLGLLLFVPGCGNTNTTHEEDAALRCAATTYPVWLLAQAVTEGVEGVEVNLVIDQEVSCLHNYTLTMRDMVAVEQADVLVINGAGLEDFLEDVLAGREIIDCSEGIELLDPEEGHDHEDGEDHDHDDGHHHDQDPHIWMDPLRYARMAQTLAEGLAKRDPEHGEAYRANAQAAAAELERFHGEMMELLGDGDYDLITFHDGFGYFAASFGMHLLAAVEEEEGSEASAKTVNTITQLVKEHHIPAVFTEVNGSDATAQTICRECGIETFPLSMCMSGEGGGLAAYEAVLRGNIETILEAYQG